MNKEIYMEEKPVNSIDELQPEALKTLSSALKRTDKTGFPDKEAINAAKFIFSSSNISDSNEYKTMLKTFRKVIIESRKKLK